MFNNILYKNEYMKIYFYKKKFLGRLMAGIICSILGIIILSAIFYLEPNNIRQFELSIVAIIIGTAIVIGTFLIYSKDIIKIEVKGEKSIYIDLKSKEYIYSITNMSFFGKKTIEILLGNIELLINYFNSRFSIIIKNSIFGIIITNSLFVLAHLNSILNWKINIFEDAYFFIILIIISVLIVVIIIDRIIYFNLCNLKIELKTTLKEFDLNLEKLNRSKKIIENLFLDLEEVSFNLEQELINHKHKIYRFINKFTYSERVIVEITSKLKKFFLYNDTYLDNLIYQIINDKNDSNDLWKEISYKINKISDKEKDIEYDFYKKIIKGKICIYFDNKKEISEKQIQEERKLNIEKKFDVHINAIKEYIIYSFMWKNRKCEFIYWYCKSFDKKQKRNARKIVDLLNEENDGYYQYSYMDIMIKLNVEFIDVLKIAGKIGKERKLKKAINNSLFSKESVNDYILDNKSFRKLINLYRMRFNKNPDEILNLYDGNNIFNMILINRLNQLKLINWEGYQPKVFTDLYESSKLYKKLNNILKSMQNCDLKQDIIEFNKINKNTLKLIDLKKSSFEFHEWLINTEKELDKIYNIRLKRMKNEDIEYMKVWKRENLEFLRSL